MVDYRKLNEKTIDDKYPLPNITDVLDKLGKANYFTILVLASGYHQIEIHPDDVEKTAFTTENGHFQFLRMSFDLKNAPASFQIVMDNILHSIQNEKCLVNLDDIIIFSTSLEEHLKNLKSVIERLRQTNFKIQLDKLEFCERKLFIITPNGVKPKPDKLMLSKTFQFRKIRNKLNHSLDC